MKHMNMEKKYGFINLQLFAAEDGEEDSQEIEDQEEDSTNEDQEDDSEEKKFSQKDMDATVRKRIAREKRKWQREQQKMASEKDTDGTGKAGIDGREDKETQELKEKALKAEELELKWTCLEHNVDKSSVDDVLALARVYVGKDRQLDIEDAIDKVLEKYPQFKIPTDAGEEEEQKLKSWGQRQTGRTKKMSGVESRFYELNPDLKK